MRRYSDSRVFMSFFSAHSHCFPYSREWLIKRAITSYARYTWWNLKPETTFHLDTNDCHTRWKQCTFIAKTFFRTGRIKLPWISQQLARVFRSLAVLSIFGYQFRSHCHKAIWQREGNCSLAYILCFICTWGWWKPSSRRDMRLHCQSEDPAIARWQFA